MTTLVERLGLAIVRPRVALAIAGDRAHVGRSGTDLMLVLVGMLAATQLFALVGAVWLGVVVDGVLGARAAMQVLTRTLTAELAFLVLGALVLFVVGGARRDLGRAFDLACVAVLPMVVVELVATTAVRALDIELPPDGRWVLTGVSWGWSGALLALATRPARAPSTAHGRTTGWALLAVIVAGIALQGIAIARDVDSLRPVTIGNTAPAFALPTVRSDGSLGEQRGVVRGKVTVLDFWATWCKPCLASLPKLQQLATTYPDIDVITINLDDAKAARAVFTRAGYSLALLFDDADVSARYSVTGIPHTVVIDGTGAVTHVFRGNTRALVPAVEQVRAGQRVP